MTLQCPPYVLLLPWVIPERSAAVKANNKVCVFALTCRYGCIVRLACVFDIVSKQSVS